MTRVLERGQGRDMKIAAWAATACLVFLAPGAGATEPVASGRAESGGAPVATTPTAGDAAPPGAQGVRAYIDPVTGELTDAPATPEQMEQAGALALPAPDYSKVTFETLADGTVIAHGNGQFESTSTMSIDAAGNTRIGCAQSGSHADHAHSRRPELQR